MISSNKVIIWNYRGVGKPGFKCIAYDMINRHKPLIFIIVETHLSSALVEKITENLSFGMFERVDPIGFIRGI